MEWKAWAAVRVPRQAVVSQSDVPAVAQVRVVPIQAAEWDATDPLVAA